MIISKLCQASLAPISLKANIRLLSRSYAPRIQALRTFTNDSKSTFSERLAKRRSLKEKLMAPASDTGNLHMF